MCGENQKTLKFHTEKGREERQPSAPTPTLLCKGSDPQSPLGPHRGTPEGLLGWEPTWSGPDPVRPQDGWLPHTQGLRGRQTYLHQTRLSSVTASPNSQPGQGRVSPQCVLPGLSEHLPDTGLLSPRAVPPSPLQVPKDCPWTPCCELI